MGRIVTTAATGQTITAPITIKDGTVNSLKNQKFILGTVGVELHSGKNGA
jgi:hypothetical protein